MKREGWEEALSSAVLTHPESPDWEERMSSAPVIVQWDPERSLRGEKLQYRSIQVGLRRQIIERFVEHWIVEIKDLTSLAKKIDSHRKSGDFDKAKRLLPPEKSYPLPDGLKRVIGVD